MGGDKLIFFELVLRHIPCYIILVKGEIFLKVQKFEFVGSKDPQCLTSTSGDETGIPYKLIRSLIFLSTGKTNIKAVEHWHDSTILEEYFISEKGDHLVFDSMFLLCVLLYL